MDFKSLKKNKNSVERLAKEIAKQSAPTFEKEEGFWKLERDQAGNGAATIRFLSAPQADGEDGAPWVRYWDHFFKGPTGKTYAELSLTSLPNLGKDPLGDYNSRLWAASDDENSWQRKQAKAQKRRLVYVANILVESDPKNPENEGKVFYFKFGKKIFDKIQECINPPFDEDGNAKGTAKYNAESIQYDPFDLWEGAPFMLRIRTVDNFPSYSESKWGKRKPIAKTDEEIEAIWTQAKSLQVHVDPAKFKTPAELKAKLDMVMGFDTSLGLTAGSTPAVTVSAPKATPADYTADDADEDDDDLAKFKALV